MTALTGLLIVLSIVVLVSGFAKLMDIRGVEEAMTSLQIPAKRLHPVAAIALPLGEIACGILLWVPVRSLAVLGALGIAVLFVAFTIIVARALRFPYPVDCACFGSLGAPAISGLTLIRNVVLTAAAVAGAPLAAAGLAPGERLALDPIHTISLTAALALAVLVTGLQLWGSGASAPAQRPQPTRTAPGVPDQPAPASAAASGEAAETGADEPEDYITTPIPYAQIIRADDETRSSMRMLAQERPALILFASITCGACTAVFQAAPSYAERLRGVVDVHLVYREEIDQLRRLETTVPVWHEPEFNASLAFDVRGRPTALLLGADGTVSGGPVSGKAAVDEFVDDIEAQLRDASLLS